MKKIVLLLSLIVASTNAYAAQKNTVSGNTLETVNDSMARVQEQVTLVQSQRGDSDLRVSFLVMDAGGSTDVSPRARLYLTTFNESEMMDAQSVHMITHLNELVSTKRESAGVYSAIVKLYDYDNECANSEGSLTATVKLTIDARQLTIDVRNFEGVEEFGLGTIQTPIVVTKECL
jgi:hypothetical protein